MKKTLLITFLFIHSLIYGQPKQSPTYYINSVKYPNLDNIYINPKNIASINVKKETENGEIYIKTIHGTLNFLTIPDILKKHCVEVNSDNSLIYFINGEVISNTSKVMVDDTYFIYVKTQSLSNATYLNKEFRKLVVVMITLSQEEIKPSIIIRGNDTTKMKDFYY